MEPLQELVARDQIRQLADRYGVAVDGKDLNTQASLFVEDVDNGRYGPGREGVKTFYDHELRRFHCTCPRHSRPSMPSGPVNGSAVGTAELTAEAGTPPPDRPRQMLRPPALASSVTSLWCDENSMAISPG